MLLLALLAFTAPVLCASGSFDYIIIGGGTAGLTVAARLSEDANTSVLVLEAGEDRSEDINVLAPGLLTSLYANSQYDWDYHTVPQTNANDHILAHPRGKQLGGSSAINFLWWTHASQQDIDNWGLLGNRNWSWDALDPFFKKSEKYIQPSAETIAALDTSYIDTDLHGSTGPVSTTFADIQLPFDEAWPRTYEKLGLSVTSDPRDGLALGGYTNLLNFDLGTRSRAYAATTYLKDANPRSNFQVVTGAHVQRILLDTSCDTPKAIGVEYLVNGTMIVVDARNEVILSAGAFGSPQLLELSGIGNPKVLRKNSITPVVSNANVGENLQDHAYVPLGFEARPGIFTLDDFANETIFNEAYEQYIGNRSGLLATISAMSALLSLEQIGAQHYPGLNASIEQHCFPKLDGRIDRRKSDTKAKSLQQSILCSDLKHEAVVQEFATPGGMSPQLSNDSAKVFLSSVPGNFLTITAVLQHPFSRGSVHISSRNASQYPMIDPRYLSHPLDIKILAAAALHSQKVVQTKPLSDLLNDDGKAFQPGYYNLTTDNAEAWVRDNLQSEFHPCGTCAMLPGKDGGVVDDRFRVYGVDGLRVVDASVFPLIPRANLQSLVYAVAERAAVFIKEDSSQDKR